MVDYDARRRLAQLLRWYVSGRIDNYTLEQAVIKSSDRGVVEIFRASWYLYDDLHRHKAKGAFAIEGEDRKEISRWILFLQTDLEYKWPKNTLLFQIASLLSFGLLSIIRRRYLQKKGDLSLWPFYREEEFKKALQSPRLLNPKAKQSD